MFKKLTATIYPLIAAVTAIFMSLVITPVTHAVTFSLQSGAEAVRGTGQIANLFGVNGIFTTVSNLMLFIVGALSVVMLIVGGLRYTVSAGNSTAVTAAKNTILYAIVGLVIAILAYAVVNFILVTLAPSGTAGTNV